jgi:hypothetical protein
VQAFVGTLSAGRFSPSGMGMNADSNAQVVAECYRLGISIGKPGWTGSSAEIFELNTERIFGDAAGHSATVHCSILDDSFCCSRASTIASRQSI